MPTSNLYFEEGKTINCGGQLIDFSSPKIMGILNVTPDSFYDGGKYCSDEEITNRAKEIIAEGADIIDIGAYSSRPGAKDISEQEESEIIFNALSIVRREFPDAIISVDTFRASIADKAITNFDVQIINDISAGEADEEMFNIIAKHNVPYIIMHMQGTPQTMQQNPTYDNVSLDIVKYFSNKVDKLRLMGVNDIVIDPGFGFGKTIEHNYQLLKNLNHFKVLNLPILAGLSRKSMLYKPLNLTANDALTATISANTIAILNGANILRVHDVKQAVESVKLVGLYNSFN
ncbi:MAG: dihydropteroate synthase [Bacteroidales bacterium]|nr:dihydropteroate synthase [Bacteroidales bacterium]